MDNDELDSILNLPGMREEIERLEAKRKRAEERAAEKRRAREAANEERRRNPKTPLDAYWNHMEQCPHPAHEPSKRRAWKRANPTFEFGGATYRDNWSREPSNSGKTARWRGWLSGSDGSTILIKDDHIGNRRNDPDRNWGLGRE